MTRRTIARPFLLALAVVFLVEARLWETLSPLVGRLLATIPLDHLKERTDSWLRSLSPAVDSPC